MLLWRFCGLGVGHPLGHWPCGAPSRGSLRGPGRLLASPRVPQSPSLRLPALEDFGPAGLAARHRPPLSVVWLGALPGGSKLGAPVEHGGDLRVYLRCIDLPGVVEQITDGPPVEPQVRWPGQRVAGNTFGFPATKAVKLLGQPVTLSLGLAQAAAVSGGLCTWAGVVALCDVRRGLCGCVGGVGGAIPVVLVGRWP